MKFMPSFVLIVFACSGCVSMSSSQTQCPTVKDLLAASSLDGEEVKVCGFLKYEFEDKNLYESAAAHRSQESCVSIGLAKGFAGDLSAHSGHWVHLSGIATSDFCPDGTICAASCSATGIFVTGVDRPASDGE